MTASSCITKGRVVPEEVAMAVNCYLVHNKGGPEVLAETGSNWWLVHNKGDAGGVGDGAE